MFKMNKKAVGLRPFVMSIVMVVLFSLFLLTFVGNTIQIQNPTSEVLDSKYGLNDSVSRMNSTISNFAAVSDDVYTQMGESEPTAVDFIFLIFKGAFYIPYTFLAFVFTGITSLTTTLFVSFAGVGIIVSLALGVLFSSIIVTIVLLIVKAIRTGEGER